MFWVYRRILAGYRGMYIVVCTSLGMLSCELRGGTNTWPWNRKEKLGGKRT